MRIIFFVLSCFVVAGCSPEKAVRIDHQLTVEQSERKLGLLDERNLLNLPDSLVGRTEAQESELLSLANISSAKGNEKWFAWIVPGSNRTSELTGPMDEGDGCLMIHLRDGKIVTASYFVAEY